MESSNSTALLLESFRSQRLNDLTRINLDDLVSSVGWENRPLLAGMLRVLFTIPARKFARQMLDFDDAVGKLGLVDGARQAQRLYVRSLRLFSAPLPAGPFLVLSNHPGTADTLALFSALNRSDLKIIAVDRPFLKSLANVSQRLFYVTDDPGARMSLVRQVSGHLRSGGAILTFPAGKIEPDANVYPGAVEALQGWTNSVGIFIRMAPETAILPIVVRGVIWEKTARHPLTRLKKTREEREKLAAAFQLLAHMILNKKLLDVTVQIGKPIAAAELGCKDTQAIHQAVLTEMKRLIEHPPEGPGVSVL
jgi:1-acyl-sn-glycerol-3-phosphate acyltransferase